MLTFWTNRLSAQFPTRTRSEVLFQTKVFEAQTLVQLGCEFVQNMAKFQCCVFGCLFIFYHIPKVYRVDNLQDWKFKWVCMENSIDCKIGDFQTEGNVIMLHKHLDKSVFVSFFLTHTCNTINKSKLYKKRSIKYSWQYY